MAEKIYHLRTTDEKIQNFMDLLPNKSKTLEDAITHFSICEILDTEKQLDMENRRLKNLKLKLDCHKSLKELKIKEKIPIILGEKKLELPKLPLEPEEQKHILGLDENNFCDFCKHNHAETEPKVCKSIDCNCGVRG